MGLYSRLFNLYEESFVDWNRDTDFDIDMGRRQFLEASAMGLAATGGLNVLTGGSRGYTGVPSRYQQDQDFVGRLDDIYENGFSGFDQDRPNVLIDVIEVGNNYLQQEVIDQIESIHDEHDINAVVGRREEKYPVDSFREEYGGDVNRILGCNGYSSFMEKEDMVFPEIRDAAVQVVMSSGKPDDPVGWLEYEGLHKTGFALDSVAMASDMAFEEGYSEEFIAGKTRVLIHEIGHSYGLEHSDDPEDLMYSEVDLNSDQDFTEQEWNTIKRRLT